MASNNPFGSFEDAFEQGVSQVKQTVKQQTTTVAKSVATQTTGTTLGIGNDAAQAAQPDAASALGDQFNETATNQQQAQSSSDDPAQQAAALQQMDVKSQQDQQQKLGEARKKLQAHQLQHKKTYFDPTFNRPKPEPTVQDRLEQDKQQQEQKKMKDLEEQKKKAPPLVVTQAHGRAERNRGVSG